MTDYIPAALRKQVIERAGKRCEYCLLPQEAAVYRHEPDHIIPRQHGGRTEAENLALACIRCNRYKGPNIGSIDPETGELVPFYNPRKQAWEAHFQLAGTIIQPLTPEGRVTARIFRLNDTNRLEERERLLKVGLYPRSV